MRQREEERESRRNKNKNKLLSDGTSKENAKIKKEKWIYKLSYLMKCRKIDNESLIDTLPKKVNCK